MTSPSSSDTMLGRVRRDPESAALAAVLGMLTTAIAVDPTLLGDLTAQQAAALMTSAGALFHALAATWKARRR